MQQLGTEALQQIRETVRRVLLEPRHNDSPRPSHTIDGHSAPVPFVNTAAEAIPPYAVMRVTGNTTISGRNITQVAKPNSEFQRQYLVNSSRGIPVNGRGGGWWLTDAGHVAVSEAGSYGEMMGAVPGQWSLAKDYPGFQIVSDITKPLGLYTAQRAIQQPPIALLGKAGHDIPYLGAGNFKIWVGVSGSEVASAFDTIVADNLAAGIAGGEWAVAVLLNSTWHLISMGETGGVARITSGVPARSGLVMGSRTGVKVTVNQDGTLTVTDDEVTLYNTNKNETGPGFVQYKRVNGLYLVDVVECDTDESV